MARAIECFECTETTPIEDGEDETVCPRCDSDNVIGADVVECPLADPQQCKDENHHWGLGKHVITDEE